MARSSGYGSITGNIWLEVGDFAFPARNWSDFIVVIPSWWLQSIIEYMNHRSPKIRFQFMDGPFFAILDPRNGTTTARFVDERESNEVSEFVLETSAASVIQQVVDAAQSVLLECKDRGWTGVDVNDLALLRAQVCNLVRNQ